MHSEVRARKIERLAQPLEPLSVIAPTRPRRDLGNDVAIEARVGQATHDIGDGLGTAPGHEILIPQRAAGFHPGAKGSCSIPARVTGNMFSTAIRIP